MENGRTLYILVRCSILLLRSADKWCSEYFVIVRERVVGFEEPRLLFQQLHETIERSSHEPTVHYCNREVALHSTLDLHHVHGTLCIFGCQIPNRKSPVKREITYL